MADTNWDWWFGDEPQRGRSGGRSPLRRLASIARWCWDLARRTPRVRQTTVWITLAGSAAIGSPLGLTIDRAAWAEDGFHPVVIPANFSLTWSNQTAADGSFTMIAQDEEANSEDEQRRERLRELLGEDKGKPMSGRSDRDDVNRDGEKAGNKGGDRLDDLSPTPRRDREQSNGSGGDLFSEPFIEERLPEVAGGRFLLPSLKAVSIDQA